MNIINPPFTVTGTIIEATEIKEGATKRGQTYLKRQYLIEFETKKRIERIVLNAWKGGLLNLEVGDTGTFYFSVDGVSEKRTGKLINLVSLYYVELSNN